MTTDVTNDSALSGAQPPQTQVPTPQGEGAGAAGAGTPPAPPSFTAEQQAAVDRIVAERLQRAREKWQADQKAKAAADTDAAEARRLEEEKKFEALARKHEARAAELETKVRQMEHDQQRRDVAQAAGIPQLWERLKGETAEELAEDAKALAAMMQPATPPNGQPPRTPTTPTPAPQGGNGLTPEERRRMAAKTF